MKLNTITIHSQECIIARTLEHVKFAGCNSPRIGIRTRIVFCHVIVMFIQRQVIDKSTVIIMYSSNPTMIRLPLSVLFSSSVKDYAANMCIKVVDVINLLAFAFLRIRLHPPPPELNA